MIVLTDSGNSFISVFPVWDMRDDCSKKIPDDDLRKCKKRATSTTAAIVLPG